MVDQARSKKNIMNYTKSIYTELFTIKQSAESLEEIMKYPIIGLTFLLISGMSAVWSEPVYSQSSQDSEAFIIEEIIVTARRREESLRDVPGTVTALTAATLESAGVARAADFIEMVPGVSMVDAAEVGDTQVNIRGINAARDAENSFAFIVDGVLYTNPAAFNREYTDLAQIEVFKGPQGAIYGRNAAAAAIIISTTTPGDERSSNLTISSAQDSTNLLKFSTSGPAGSGDKSFRISADWRESDGFYRNSFQNGAPIVDAYEGFNVNGRLFWEVNDKLTVDTKVRIGEVDASSITFNSTFNLPVFAAALNNPPAFQDVNDFDFLFHANMVSDNDQDSFEFSSKFDYDMDDRMLMGWLLYSDIENSLMSDGTSAAFGFYNGDPVCQQTVLDLGWAGSSFPLLAPQFIGMTPTGVIFDPNGSFLGAYTPTTCDGIQEQVRSQKDFSMELRPAIPAVTAPISNSRITVMEMIIAGTRLFSDLADMNRTISWGTPIKPIPIATKLTMAIKETTPAPLAPQALNRLGSSERSVLNTACQPPAASMATIGTMTSPSSIRMPCIRSVQATAL